MNCCTSFIFYIIGALVCTFGVEAQKIRGIPGVDYPNYSEIPRTSFRCSEQKYIPGFYADVETQCQVFHFCFESRQESFLCPTGTIFSQKILGCDSWYSSNCSLAPLFYNVNAGSGIEQAGKGISMLLKMQDRTRDSTRASTSSVLEKISSLYEASTEQAQKSDSNVENAASEGSTDEQSSKVDEPKSENMQESSIDKASVNVSEVFENLIAGFEKIKNKENSEDEKSFSDSSTDPNVDDGEGFYSQHMNKGFVYDPETQQYYMNDYDPSETDWEDDSESMNEEYRNFYDEDISLHSENEPANIFGNYVVEQANEVKDRKRAENSPKSVDLDDQNSFYMDEFSKRILEAQQQPRSSRRKPVYVVLDDSDVNSPSELNYFTEPTESSHFTESISIDDLISESRTDEPLQWAIAEDFKTLDSFQQDGIEDIKAKMDEGEFRDDSQLSEEVGAQSVSELDSQISDLSQQGESEEETADFDTFEIDRLPYPTEKSEEVMDENFQGEDPSAYSESDVTEDQSYNYDFMADEDSDDIQILQDGNEQDVPESEAEQTELDQTLYIPDPMDYENAESEETDYNSVSYPQNEDWAYMYSDSRENPASDDLYESAQAGAQELDSEETGSYDSYAEYIDQRYVPYSPESVDSQYLPPEYKSVETREQILPEGYRYMLYDSDGNLHPYEVPSASYRTEALANVEYSQPDMQTSEDLAANEYYPDVGALEESDVGSYGYSYVQPNMQQMGSMGDYSYGQDFGYVYDSNGVPYSYENSFDDQNQAASFEDLEESENIGESLSQESSEEAETDENESEPKEEGKENFENLDAGSRDLGLDYIEGDATEQTNFDVNADEKNEEIYYLLDTDEDAEKQEGAEEVGYDPMSLDYDGSLSYSNYLENGPLDGDIDLSEETGHDILKPESGTVVKNMQSTQTSKAVNESKSEGVSAFHTSSVEPKDKILDTQAIADDLTKSVFHGKNVEHITGGWPSHTTANKESIPATFSSMQDHGLAGFDPVQGQSFGGDFIAPSEMFMNNMAFPNSVGFNPYGYGSTNMGHQLGMIDSSNTAAFTKKNGEVIDHKENADQTRLSKLSSLKDKVLSMKRGKFGMFKKSLKTL